MFDFFGMHHRHWTTAARIFTGKRDRVGDLLQNEISDAG